MIVVNTVDCYRLSIIVLNIVNNINIVNIANLKIIDMNFSDNKRKRKIAESLWIKDLRPTLNV